MKISEIIATEKFDELLHVELEKIEQKKIELRKGIEDVKICGEQIKIKRCAVIVLEEMDMLNKPALTAEFERILNKQSKLPTREREFIYNLYYNCMLRTVMHLQKLEESAVQD